MRIAFVASEAVPFCKTGGLADVAGALPLELARRGHEIALFLPYYRGIRDSSPKRPALVASLSIPMEGRVARGALWRLQSGAGAVFFVDCPAYFDRAQLYQEHGKDYEDNGQRFAFFCRAVLEGCKLAAFRPDVFHCHDWQTGLVAAYRDALYQSDRFFSGSALLFTVHNMAYQGLFPKETLAAAGLPLSEFTMERMEYYGKVSYLKAGLTHADLLSTVSPTYAREIQSSSGIGMGMEGLLRQRGADVYGVLNGLDQDRWNPSADKSLPRVYGVPDYKEGKAACRNALQAQCVLKPGLGPLIGSVSRLDRQKGLDLALAALPPCLERGARFVLVGQGDPGLEKDFTAFARRSPGRAYYRGAFDEAFARLVYAASDLFLMPSRFEPCGLGQMIAMRYGSLPLGTLTGGLADTIVEEGPGANGFLAREATVEEVSRALDLALGVYPDGSAWEARVRAAMSADFSWTRAVDAYEGLYEKAVQRRTNANRA